MDSAEEHRCMVRLMKMSLGLNDKTAEAFLSPKKAGSEDIKYEDVEVEEVYL